jgi:hypothetical protein
MINYDAMLNFVVPDGYFGTFSSSVPVLRSGDCWVVTNLPDRSSALFVPGDVLRADEVGRVVEIVRPSSRMMLSVLPSTDHLSADVREDFLSWFDSRVHQGRLSALVTAVMNLTPFVRSDGLILTVACGAWSVGASIAALPHVCDVQVERYPGGLVHTHPLRVGDPGPLRPIDMDWLTSFAKMEPDELSKWPQMEGLVVPDTVPDEWAT